MLGRDTFDTLIFGFGATILGTLQSSEVPDFIIGHSTKHTGAPCSSIGRSAKPGGGLFIRTADNT